MQPEIESFNLADLDVGALDARLELTMLIPSCTLRICEGYSSCECNIQCGVYSGSNCHVN